MDNHASGVQITKNVIESGGGYGVCVCRGCQGISAINNIIILQPAAYYDRGSYGSTYSSGSMMYKGVTYIDLLPSYFPRYASTSMIVVQLSGQDSGGTHAIFNIQVDGNIVGSAVASENVSDYLFSIALTTHQIHRVGIELANGATSGTPTTELNSLALFVNGTAVQLVDPEASGHLGAYGFRANPADLMVSDVSVKYNIVYRDGGSSQDFIDTTVMEYPTYVDPNAGIVDYNDLYYNVLKASDSVFGQKSLDIHSIASNPMFIEPSQGDYSLSPLSPAINLGFNINGLPLGDNP